MPRSGRGSRHGGHAAHAAAARPPEGSPASPKSPEVPGTPLPPPPGPRGTVGPGSDPANPGCCKDWELLGFCYYGLDCDFTHRPEKNHVLSVSPTADLIVALNAVVERHEQGQFHCMLCTNAAPDSGFAAAVGDTSSYRYCPTCGHFYFQPIVQILAVRMLREAGQDYTQYKERCDAITLQLRPSVRIAFHYEAGRWGTTRFAWTLAAPRHFKEILRIIWDKFPAARRFVSMGAGTGCTEHMLLQAAREMGQEVEVLAYDLTPLPNNAISFDVSIQIGSVEQLQTLGDLTDTILLLSWPPFGSSLREESTMGHDALLTFQRCGGRCLIYIGDVNATGDWRFHEVLSTDWLLLNQSLELTPLPVWCPEMMGLRFAGNDSCGIYVVRDKPHVVAPWGPISPPEDSQSAAASPAQAEAPQ